MRFYQKTSASKFHVFHLQPDHEWFSCDKLAKAMGPQRSLPPSPSLFLTPFPSPAQEITAQSTLTTKPKHPRVPKNSCSGECLGVPGWKKRENLDMYRKKNLKPQKSTIYVIGSPPEYELVSLALFLLASGSRYKKCYHHCAYPCFPVACLFAKWLFFITFCVVYSTFCLIILMIVAKHY